VETEKQLAFLKAEGCEAGQGYFFCKPKTAEELEPLLRKSMPPTAKVGQQL
jgi:EAL domain-containing protein (putative c-di-GMP-specific phosphodiesterase class I)